MLIDFNEKVKFFFELFSFISHLLFNKLIYEINDLIKTVGFTHGALDVESSDVLPVLLQQRDQKVDWQHDVGGNLINVHVNVSDSNGQAQDLENNKKFRFDKKSYYRNNNFQKVPWNTLRYDK